MSKSTSLHSCTRPKRKVLPTVLNFMDGSRQPSNHGPKQSKPSTDIFDLLRRAVNERRRIEVLTRDCRGIYGILIGWLIVFDKHMNLIMSDVDEVFRRLTDGHDYLELGSKREHSSSIRPVASSSSSSSSSSTMSKTTEITNDFQTFRAQLANFLRNKKKQPVIAKPLQSTLTDEDNHNYNNNDDDEYQQPSECHPEQILSMELLSMNNITVQRLNSKIKPTDSSLTSSSSSSSTISVSKRAKVRFFSRHIPKLFIKGNQVCLIRLLSA